MKLYLMSETLVDRSGRYSVHQDPQGHFIVYNQENSDVVETFSNREDAEAFCNEQLPKEQQLADEKELEEMSNEEVSADSDNNEALYHVFSKYCDKLPQKFYPTIEGKQKLASYNADKLKRFAKSFEKKGFAHVELNTGYMDGESFSYVNKVVEVD